MGEWPPERPLATVETVKGRRQLAAVDAAARAAGLKVGMEVAHASAVQSDLALVDTDLQADAALLFRLAVWAMRYTPLVSLDPPDGLWLDVSGCAHLFGGEEALLARLTARIKAMGLAVCAGLADTPGTAHAVTRFAKGGVVPAGSTDAAMEPLPIGAMRLPPDIVSGLQGLGFTRVHQLMEMPRGPLAGRFGSLPLLRLDQALGHIGEALQPIDPPPMPRCSRGFMDPIATPESLAQVTRDLCGDICAVLEPLGQGARRVDLIFHRIDGVRLAIRIGTARPSRDAQHLARLLIEQLDTVEPGLGIETMELAASRVERLAHCQEAAFERDRPAPDLSGLVDRLSNRFGSRLVWRAVPLESQLGERSVGRAIPLAPSCSASWPADLPRPVRMIDPPEPIDVIAQAPDYPPAAFAWRSKRYRVHLSDGMERIFSEWWHGDALYGVRDYFRVEVEGGGRYWLFRLRDEEQPAAAPPRWFIHGAFG